MTRLLLFIKHKVPIVWTVVEKLNSLMFRMLHKEAVMREANTCLSEFSLDGFSFRMIESSDLSCLSELLVAQDDSRLEFFRPHSFDIQSLTKLHQDPAFLMFGVFDQDMIVGYFFLRCFCIRRCFVGRLIDSSSERKGIGRVMNSILYNTAWRSRFRCFTTVSKGNAMVMRSHSNNPAAVAVTELADDFVLIEFICGE